jgi:PTH1 family peptidyl-tRNA hydrolase
MAAWDAFMPKKPVKEKIWMWIVVGLGNPGKEYEKSRHNAGYLAVSAAARSVGARFIRRRFESVAAETQYNGEKVVFIKPKTYMNASGRAVRAALSYYRLDPSRLIVIYDDVDLELGKLRIRASGSAGTHNGMRSILSETGSGGFPRIRIGIGKQPERMDLADYVLGKFGKDEAGVFSLSCERAGEAALAVIREGIAAAQARYNG